VILIGILVLVFGAKKLPDMARSVGQSARVFKGEMKSLHSDDLHSDEEKSSSQPALPAGQTAPAQGDRAAQRPPE
jgi:sec-independent protein translocase protein TatA